MCTKQSLLVFFIILNVFLQQSENGDRLSLLYGFSIIRLRSAGGCGFRKMFCIGSSDYGEHRPHPTLGPTVDGLKISAPTTCNTQSTTPPPPPLPPKVHVKKGSFGGSQSQIPPFPLSLPYETGLGSRPTQSTGNGSKKPSNTDSCSGKSLGNPVSPPPPRVISLYDNVPDCNRYPMDAAPKKPPLPANWRSPPNSRDHDGVDHRHQDDCGNSSYPPQKPHLPVGFRLRK
ncbi:Uncharacterized protein CTYZ_00000583 [Cryptosporidium tyzzeri]|nr:Uncharacterized protein CTYZ_00000583 [Cryptosporidium tyzzeri]